MTRETLAEYEGEEGYETIMREAGKYFYIFKLFGDESHVIFDDVRYSEETNRFELVQTRETKEGWTVEMKVYEGYGGERGKVTQWLKANG